MFFDIYAKFSYYSYSRFSSVQLREMYWGTLWIRPILLSLLVMYNYCIGLKLLWKEKTSAKIMFKDDITYQHEQEVKKVQETVRSAVCTETSQILKEGGDTEDDLQIDESRRI